VSVTLPPTCERPVTATATPPRRVVVQCLDLAATVVVSLAAPVQAIVTASRPVAAIVTCAPAPKPFALSTDENFVLLPIAGGTLARVPYDPVS